MSISEFKELLLRVTDKVFHYVAQECRTDFIVWQVISGSAVNADDRHLLKNRQVQVDVYSRDEYSLLPGLLELELQMARVPYREPFESYEPETDLTRWRYTVRVVGNG